MNDRRVPIAIAVAILAWGCIVDMTPEEARDRLEMHVVLACRNRFEPFFRVTAPVANPKEYKYGKHTLAIIRRLDRVTKDLEAGKSTFLRINIPVRHGKSDIFSRRWPVWHMIRNPDHEVMLLAYNELLATDMSYDALRCFIEVAPDYGLAVDRDRSSVKRWRIAQHKGSMFATGLGGTVVGRGGQLILIEDYIKTRADAESKRARDKLWEAFSSDVWTRRPHPVAVVICCSRRHLDDLDGRIERRSTPGSDLYDPDFPEFEVMRFPAQAEDGSWLFPEMFPPEHYRGFKAAGGYAWSAEGQQHPERRQGNLLKVERVKYLDRDEFIRLASENGVRWTRGWDLASSSAERAGDDPDYTVGVKAAGANGKLFFADMIRGRWTAPKRDEIIRNAVCSDGPGTRVRVEAVGGYKDAYERLRAALIGLVVVEPCYPSQDKWTRATVMEAAFESDNVYAMRGDWNEPWSEDLGGFDKGTHDDCTDASGIAVIDDIQRQLRGGVSIAVV